MWLSVVTMTTVGFGDFYPRTHFGRVIGSFSAVIGIFWMSLTIMVITKILEPDTQ